MDTRGSNQLRQRSPLLAAALCLGLALFPPFLRGDETHTATSAESTTSTQRIKQLTLLGAASWHEAGIRGQGIKVAILDTGFRGYKDLLGKSLPARISTHCFRSDGNLEGRVSQHGLLCAEVIHTIAPEAELLLVTWDPEEAECFLDAVRWAREQGARLLSCSVIMPTWSDCEGNGPVHRELTKLLAEGANHKEALCFASAGNTAQRHWCGVFHDGGDGWHEWARGQKDNELRPWGADPVSVELCWSSGDYELVVVDATRNVEVARSSPRKGLERGCAVVRVDPVAGHSYFVRVCRVEGRATGTFHLVALGAMLDQVTAQGSIAFPGDGPEVVTVGAVGSDGLRAAYSSCGTNSKLPKPDLVAAVPFACGARARPFAGTSAAAPQAAALAALVWSQHPSWTAERVRESLIKSARDLGLPGHDWETGYGLIGLPALK
jgi:subtilisin family serine protease